ncbi:anti-sigma factor [Candidatus Aminicenantes bacterium AC-335-A11]|jgi:hypothetical protein|nr:anti-sigma factor [SCandidatus Aminicenantes bacterium Aminicenantia_JdfR_composite]MCP2618448.1 anti-sigma factor [Candidatus Aminicenantes bacterium AC-335-A11]
MRCLRIEQIYDYLEGEVSPVKKLEIEKHISTCPKCFKIFMERKTLLEGIKEIPRIEPPSDFVKKIMDKILLPSVSWLKVAIYTLSISFIFSFLSIILIKTTNQTISSLFREFIHFSLETFKYITIFLAKLIKTINFIFKISAQLIKELMILISSATSLELKFQIIILSFIIVSIIVFILYFPLKKILVKT